MFVAILLLPLMLSAQPAPVDVTFKMLDLKDPYATPYPGVPNANVRLILGASPDWQNPDSGHRFTTHANGEAHFTMNGVIDTVWRSRNIGMLPFGWPSRADHMQIALELDHEFPQPQNKAPKLFRWVITLDLDCFSDGTCSTSDFMAIFSRDEKGRFTRALPRQAGSESWKPPELDGQVMFGMSYRIADFTLENRRTLKLAVKKVHRIAR